MYKLSEYGIDFDEPVPEPKSEQQENIHCWVMILLNYSNKLIHFIRVMLMELMCTSQLVLL